MVAPKTLALDFREFLCEVELRNCADYGAPLDYGAQSIISDSNQSWMLIRFIIFFFLLSSFSSSQCFVDARYSMMRMSKPMHKFISKEITYWNRPSNGSFVEIKDLMMKHSAKTSIGKQNQNKLKKSCAFLSSKWSFFLIRFWFCELIPKVFRVISLSNSFPVRKRREPSIPTTAMPATSC